ncbi:MAG: DsrE/DsrF/DrsH-like family protein [Candidatus Omnitrophica bacterium]|nr:DsrE/DsrF/DrsH-like family protein [Candidatus Omnitrophota bacterium]
MKSLAIIVSQGSTNNLVQVVTLLMAAVHSELKARVLFRDESLFRLTTEGIKRLEFSDGYRAQQDALAQRLKKHELDDLQACLRQIKESGDVKLYACSSSLALSGLKREELIPEIDDVRGLPAFLLEDVAAAEKVLTF